MLFKYLFIAQLLSKKTVATAATLGLTGSLGYWGVVRPLNNQKSTEHLIGSKPLLHSYRGDPDSWRLNDSYLVSDFKRTADLPSNFPALSVNTLKLIDRQENIRAFNGSMRPYLTSNQRPCVIGRDSGCVVFNEKHWDKNFPLIQTSSQLKWDDERLGAISEIEIPYKSLAFNRKVIHLEKSQIIQDLVWSLAEEAEVNKTVIRPHSISVDFHLEKVDTVALEALVENKQTPIPIPANKVNNFLFKFRIYNPNPDAKKVLKSILVHPYQEVDVTVSLDRSEIRPFSLTSYASRQRVVKWGLIPSDGYLFNINVETRYPVRDTKKFRTHSLSLMHSNSKFIRDTIDNSYKRPGVINAPTYREFSNITTPYLVGLTTDQVKKDIETWYGSLAAFHTRLRINDLQKLINIMEMKLFPGKGGKFTSYIDAFIDTVPVRYSVYSYIRLEDQAIKALDLLFGPVGKAQEYHVKAQEIVFLLKALSSALKEMENSMEVKLKWIEEPKLSISDDEDMSPYPAVSFHFQQEITWTKKINIPFKGCWNDQNGKYDYKEKDSECTNGSKWFDLSKKLDKLNEIVSPLQSIMGSFVVNNLIPNASQFLGWSKWEIEANEKIVNSYKAVKSPIRPSITNTSDSWENRKVIPGWKAMDVTVTHDLSNFYKFFYKIYEKLDTYRDSDGINITSFTGALGSVGQLANIKNIVQKNPVSFAVHIINQLFDKNYWSKGKQSHEDQRPWPLFFKTLLSKPLNIDSSQLFVGYSRSMFDVEKWVDDLGTTSGQEKTYKISDDWQSKSVNKTKSIDDSEWDFPIKFRNRNLETLMESYELNYSQHFPKAPMIMEMLDSSENKKWNLFLKNQGSTNVGFIKYKDLIKNSLIELFHEQDLLKFPDKKFINWSKVKISVTQLELEKALKTVLGLENQLSTSLSTALKTQSIEIDFNTLLGEFIQRDAMIVTVNMMAEEGSMFVIRKPLKIPKKSVYSLYQFHISPNLDVDKLGGGIPNIRKKYHI